MGKFRVVANQNVKYNETLVGEAASYEDAQKLMALMLTIFPKVTVSIGAITEEIIKEEKESEE